MFNGIVKLFEIIGGRSQTLVNQTNDFIFQNIRLSIFRSQMFFFISNLIRVV